MATRAEYLRSVHRSVGSTCHVDVSRPSRGGSLTLFELLDDLDIVLITLADGRKLIHIFILLINIRNPIQGF